VSFRFAGIISFFLIALVGGFANTGPLRAESGHDSHAADSHGGSADNGHAAADGKTVKQAPKIHAPVHVWEKHAIYKSGHNAPYKIVRKITALQNRIIRGDRSAFDVQQARLVAASKQLLEIDRTHWISDLRDARAALKFVMSGGPPDILRFLIDNSYLPTRYLKLAVGVLAYAEGRKADANRLLRNVDPRELEASLGGHLALIKALSVGARRPNEIRKLLNDARLLSPGTIVEESALRRQIPLEAMQPDNGQFDMLVSRYLRRFSQSVYANGLLLQVAETLARDDYAGGDEKKMRAIEGFLDHLRPAKRKRFLMTLARAGTARGLTKTTLFAVEEAKKIKSALLLEDEAPLQLYEASMEILGDNFERGETLLNGVEDELLTVEQAELRRATVVLAKSMRRWPETPVVKDAAKFEAENGGQLPWPEAADARKSAKQSEDLIASIDSLLVEIDR
jgi:chemotaxis protein MotC